MPARTVNGRHGDEASPKAIPPGQPMTQVASHANRRRTRPNHAVSRCIQWILGPPQFPKSEGRDQGGAKAGVLMGPRASGHHGRELVIASAWRRRAASRHLIVGQVNYKAAVVLRVSHGSRFLA